MDDQIQVRSNNFRVDLMSSLFGNQIALGILDQNPKIDVTNQTCTHRIFIGKICTRCGSHNNDSKVSTVPFWYIYPDLSLSSHEITRIRDENLQTLLSRKKLHLVLDLDHTLLHKRGFHKLTAEDKKSIRGIDHNTAEGEGKGTLLKEPIYGWVKLRPYVRSFLEEASTMFEMTIYTLSCRFAARHAAKVLDPNGEYFDNWRMIANEDSVVLDKHKKTLDLVLQHERVVLVLDDNEKVWEDFKGNHLKITPYHYFSNDCHKNKKKSTGASWLQQNADESEVNGELSKVLAKLRTVHAAFYDDSGVVEGREAYASRDVRRVLEGVQMGHYSVDGKLKHQKQRRDFHL